MEMIQNIQWQLQTDKFSYHSVSYLVMIILMKGQIKFSVCGPN